MLFLYQLCVPAHELIAYNQSISKVCLSRGVVAHAIVSTSILFRGGVRVHMGQLHCPRFYVLNVHLSASIHQQLNRSNRSNFTTLNIISNINTRVVLVGIVHPLVGITFPVSMCADCRQSSRVCCAHWPHVPQSRPICIRRQVCVYV